VLQQNETTAALLCVDSIGFSRKILGDDRDFTVELRQRIAALTCIMPDHIVVATTHAHSTPETINFKPLRKLPGAIEWLEHLLDTLARCVAMAHENLRPAQLKIGKGQCAQIPWNRHSRDLDGKEMSGKFADREISVPRPIDPDVDVLLIEYETAPPDAVVRFTCHPVIVQVQPFWSSDFPGVACGIMEKATGGNCLFLQGAAGDINPVCATAGFDEVNRIGKCLGDEALKVVEELRTNSDNALIAGELECVTSTIQVPSRALPDEKNLPDNGRLEAGRDRITMGDEPFQAEVQVLSIGDFALAALPGEPFVEFGFEIQKSSPFKHTWVAGYCNDYLGYFSKDWAWRENVYPTLLGPWCLLSQEGGQMIIDEAIRLLKENNETD
jgi:hypothetical protein